MDIEESASSYIPNDEATEKINTEIPENGPKKNSIFNMLKSETGEGTILSYNNHPLNIKNDKNISQIIRGLSGILGSLNYAILDIILGCFGLVKEQNETQDVDFEEVKKENVKGPTVVNGQKNV
jgi:hypothetical protein